MNIPTRTPRLNFRAPVNALLLAGFCTLAVAGEAAASTYNFWLKSAPDTPYGGTTKCAAGAFSFTKTGVPGSPVNGITLPIAQNCISAGSPPQALSLTGTLNVVVRNITLNGQNQGPNVDGLTGLLTSGQFIKSCTGPFGAGTQIAQWSVNFKSAVGVNGAPGARKFDLMETVGSCTNGTPNFNPQQRVTTNLVTDGPYHIRNTANSIPEPESLWLALGGLGALAWARRLRKRA